MKLVQYNLCGNLPQGGFTSSDQAIFIVISSGEFWPFSVVAVYIPFWGQYDMDLPPSQSARSIGVGVLLAADSQSTSKSGYRVSLWDP
jgi:hypothetical protein